VDGRQGGRDAIALAIWLAGPVARTTLAHVDPIETHPSGSESRAESRKMLSDERVGGAIVARIGVGRDGSRESMQALEAARAIAARTRSSRYR
jgi:hypothetical protein